MTRPICSKEDSHVNEQFLSSVIGARGCILCHQLQQMKGQTYNVPVTLNLCIIIINALCNVLISRQTSFNSEFISSLKYALTD